MTMLNLGLGIVLLSTLGCSVPEDPTATPDSGGGGKGDGSDGGSDAVCTDPFTSESIADGASIVSYTLASAATQAACDATRITSTCSAGVLEPSPGPSAKCMVTGGGGGCDPVTGAGCVDDPLPPAGTGYYFSDCGTGAASGCTAGNDANDGLSPQTPKRTFAGFNFNMLPAGTNVLLARGGAWDVGMIRIDNPNVTPQAPLVIRAYGTGPAPVLRATSTILFQLGGNWGNTNNDGGYTIRDLRLDGRSMADWGIWLVQNVTHVTLFQLNITNFDIAVHASGGAPHGINNLTIDSSYIHRNGDMGYLGSASNVRFENNVFEANNFSGSGFNHAIYYSNGDNALIRNNRFIRNSVVGGRCTGGNVTVHGVVDGLTIEGNEIVQDAGDPGCYGFSITAGYTDPEVFLNVVVRDNIVRNVGNCAVCIDSAPGALIEGNLSIKAEATAFHATVLNPPNGEEDAPTTGAIVRNNTMCQPMPASGNDVVIFRGANTTLSNNTLITGAAATSGVCAS